MAPPLLLAASCLAAAPAPKPTPKPAPAPPEPPPTSPSAPSPTKPRIATLIMLGSAQARCLDGSAPGYYVQQSAEAGTKEAWNWVIFLVGGGNCRSATGCRQKADTPQGSSRFGWPRTMPGNPFPGALGRWNFVQVQYCSGDSFTGTRGEYQSWQVHISGHLILGEVVSDLQQRYGMGVRGGKVMLSGDSSGGHGVYTNVEWLQRQLPDAEILAAPFAGWYFPNVTTFAVFNSHPDGGWETDPDYWNYAVERKDWKSYMPQSCVEANKPPLCPNCTALQESLCFTTGYLVNWMQVPTFVVENQFDPTKTFTLGCPGCHRAGLTGDGADSAKYVAYQQYYARRLAAGVADFASHWRNGGFFPSCYDHDSNLWNGSQPLYNDTLTGPVGPSRLADSTALEALALWVDGRSDPAGPPADLPQRTRWLWRDDCNAGSGCVPCAAEISDQSSGWCESPWRTCSGVRGAPVKCPAPAPAINDSDCPLPSDPTPTPVPSTQRDRQDAGE